MQSKISRPRLGVNIDHVATLRNARGGDFPCPVAAAKLAIEAGADGITAHLREDRRHIRDRDIERLKAEIEAPLNLEMAATEEMLAIALRVKPHAVCLVPEKREELTTEGGLDAHRLQSNLKPFVEKLVSAGIRVSLFIDADEKQLLAAREVGAPVVELHTGAYAAGKIGEYEKIVAVALLTNDLGIECHAGHGLNVSNVQKIAAITSPHGHITSLGGSIGTPNSSKNLIKELNIGHFLIGEAIFSGLENTVKKMLKLITEAA